MENSKNTELEEVKAKVSKGLEVARWKLLDDYPFIGEMLLRFSIVPTYDVRISTAATNGSKIFFDCEFYSTLTQKQREFVLAHEVWHNIYLHFLRLGTRNPMLWNIATDMEINHMLKNEGMELIKDCCLPEPIVAGKCAEDIYNYLMKNQNNQNNQNQNQNQNEDDGEGEGGGEGEGNSNGNGKNQGNGSGNKSSSSKKKKKNGKGDNGGNQFDKHIYGEDSSEDGNGEPKEGKWGPKGIDPDCNLTMGDPKEVENNIKDMVCSVAQSIERKQGHLPAGIESMVKEMLKPEIPWKEKLSQFVTRTLGGEHSWRRVSRHALGRGHYLPGRTDDFIKVAVGLDTSGSCLHDLPKFLGELDGLLKSFGKYEITLIQCDAEIQDVQKYDDSNPIDLKREFKAKGFGGTDARPFFKWIKDSGEEYNAIVIMTDGATTAPTYPVGTPTLWVITSDGYTDFCDWGEKMKFKPKR